MQRLCGSCVASWVWRITTFLLELREFPRSDEASETLSLSPDDGFDVLLALHRSCPFGSFAIDPLARPDDGFFKSIPHLHRTKHLSPIYRR